MNQLVRWIDEQIDKHQTEIARLMVARGVIEQASDAVAAKPSKAEKPAKPKVRRAVTTALPRGETKHKIIKALLEIGHPVSSQGIFAHVQSQGSDLTQKRIWNTLYTLKDKGEVERDSTSGYYYLPQMPQEPMVANQ
jgi:hypothetical protein